ncbi:hypothetical protein ISS86_02185 [Candidatus Microgenomates bacterium]|nr:hypothetical protein [Candidatus Microgenomates bacterium]
MWQENIHKIDDVVTIKGFEIIFSKILSLATTAAGLVCFLMLIVGGFKYLTAGNDPKQVSSAQGTLTWAIGGLAIIIGAWLILQFIEYFTGVRITIFEIPSD